MNMLEFSYADVENCVHSIAREILLSTWHPDYIVGLTRGGLFPANLLSQFLDVPMVALNVSFRDNTIVPNQTPTWLIEEIMLGKNVLVVDDINDSGKTLNWIVNDWQNCCRPVSAEWKTIWFNRIRFAVVINNLSSSFVMTKPNHYIGNQINKAEEDTWIVFPWENWWLKKV